MSRKVLIPGINPFQVHVREVACNTLFAVMCLDVPLFSHLNKSSYFLKNGFEQSSGTTSCVEKYLTKRYLSFI